MDGLVNDDFRYMAAIAEHGSISQAARAMHISQPGLSQRLKRLEQQLGTEKTAVVEGFDKWAECYFGRTAADAPDIDGKVFFTSERQLRLGEYVQIQITDTLDYDLLGEVIA